MSEYQSELYFVFKFIFEEEYGKRCISVFVRLSMCVLCVSLNEHVCYVFRKKKEKAGGGRACRHSC
jgi:hypothetical protein